MVVMVTCEAHLEGLASGGGDWGGTRVGRRGGGEENGGQHLS